MTAVKAVLMRHSGIFNGISALTVCVERDRDDKTVRDVRQQTS